MSLTVVKDATCTFCGCVCDDIELHADGERITHTKNACVLGVSWFKNHTVERLYPLARPGGRYHRALELLARARRMVPGGLTKSGMILGMGEEWDELLVAMRDLRRSDVNILTLGQYLRPSERHLPVARFYPPEEFAELREIGMRMGFDHVQASPLTRSSYHAGDDFAQLKAARAAAS